MNIFIRRIDRLDRCTNTYSAIITGYIKSNTKCQQHPVKLTINSLNQTRNKFVRNNTMCHENN